MKEKFSDIMCKCKKPAVTLHCGNGCTITVIGVALICFIIIFHIAICKMHSLCTKCKLRKAKKAAEN